MNSWRTLHKSSIFIMFATRVKDFLIPLFLSLFAGGTAEAASITRWIFPALLLMLFLYSVLYWLTFRYRIEGNELRIKHGIIIKKNRFIRRNRVQSVDVTSGILHRMFRLAKVKIETAGGGMEPEVSLIAVGQPEAQLLRKLLSKDEQTEEAQPLPEKVNTFLYQVPMKDIILAGITSGKVGIVFSFAAAVLSQIEQFLPRDFYERSIGVLFSIGTTILILLFIFISIIAWLISIIITVLQYGKFVVTKNDNQLVIERGILERRQLTLQLERITSIRYISNPIRQCFGLWTIYVDSAGGGTQEEQLSTILLPLGRKKELDSFMRGVLPDARMPDHIPGLPQNAAPRYVLRASLIWWLLTVPAVIWLPSGYLFLLLPLVFTILGWLRYKDSGLLFLTDQCILQTRMFSLSCNVLPRRRIQSLTLKQSYLQKRKKLYTFSANILSTHGGRTFRLKDIDERNPMEWYRGEGKVRRME